MRLKERKAEIVPESVAAVLSRRAERYRQAHAADENRDASEEWIAEIALADETFALPLRSVRAVVPLRGISPLPLAPPWVLGLLRYQGEVIAAMNSASVLGVRGWKTDPHVLVVVAVSPEHLVAMDSETIPAASTLPRRLVEAARASAKGPVIDMVTPELRPIRYIDDLAAILNRRLGGHDAG